MSTEFLAEYASLLKGLERNDKRDINVLSMLAEDNKEFCSGIVATIESHILTCPAPAKLPALYVVDSIVKNVGDPYRSGFANRLPEVFGAVWSSAMQDRRTSLSKLFKTWSSHFPQPVLDQVAARMVSTSQPAAPLGPQRQSATVITSAAMPMGVGMPLTGMLVQQQPGGINGYLLTSSAAQAPMPMQQPTLVLAPQPQPATYMAQQPVYHYTTAAPGNALQQQQQQQQPYYVHQPVAQPYGYAPAPAPAPVGGAPTYPQQQHAVAAPYPQQQQPQQHMVAPMGMHVQPAPAAPVAHAANGRYVPVSPPHVWQQPQQQPLQHAMDPRRSPSPLPAHMRSSRASASPLRPMEAPVAQAQMTSQQISSLLASLAKTGALAATKAASPIEDASLHSTQFNPAWLKEFHPSVLWQLQQATAEHRGSFLDLVFLRKQRQRDGAGASRQWFVGVDAWIAGTLAVREAVPAFFEEEGDDQEAPPEVHNEPEDPTQPECALSGEPFDKVFDPAHDGWFYRDARRLHGDEAARYGVADGAIVKVKCLAEAGFGGGGGGGDAGSGGSSGGGAFGGGVDDAAGLAADLAAAAAGASATAAAAAAAEQTAPGEGEAAPEVAGGNGGGPGTAPLDGADVKHDVKDPALLAAAARLKRSAEDADAGSVVNGLLQPDLKRVKGEA